jgi:surfactin family lipopeptide synthetase A
VTSGTPTANVLCAIWSDVLDIESVDPQENFFDLGGHSFLAIQIIMKIQEIYGVELPLVRFLETPTVLDQAATIEKLLLVPAGL